MKQLHYKSTDKKDLKPFSRFQKTTLLKLKRFQKDWGTFEQRSWKMLKQPSFFYIIFIILLSAYLGLASPIYFSQDVLSFIPNFILKIAFLISTITFGIYIIRLVLCGMIGNTTMFRWKNYKYIAFETTFFFFLIFWLWNFSANIIRANTLDLIKIIVSASIIGFFCILNMHFLRTRYRYIQKNETHELLKNDVTKIVSIRRKNMRMTIGLVLLVALTMYLTNTMHISRIIALFETKEYFNPMYNQYIILRENIYVLAILLFLIALTTIIYSTNIRLILIALNNTVFNLFSGKYNEIHIPIANDDLGILSEHINIISAEEQEKEKIRAIFGKHIPEKIAYGIMESRVPLTKGGNTRETTILCANIRNTKNIIQHNNPRETVVSLNKYFTDMEDIVESYGGIIDKFIGSSFYSLFGIEERKKGMNNAVRAAYHIQEHLKRIKSKFSTCIGIGAGESIIGLIGSSQRLEFTALGKNVEISTRLQQVTSKIGVDIVIESSIYKNLNLDLKELPWKKFQVQLRDGNNLHIYGLKIANKR